MFASPAILSTAVPGSQLKLHTFHLVREDQQALYGFRTAEDLGFFTLLLTVNGVGPKVALAIVGSRPTRRPPARDHGPGPGRPRVDPGHRQEARRADHLRAQGEGRRRPGSRRASERAAGIGAAESEVVAALQALGYSLAEAREASRIALADPTIGGTLEDRVKAALRSLLRD